MRRRARIGGGVELVVRPYRVRWVAGIAATVVVVVSVTAAVLLRKTPTGVHFRFADQVSLMIIGLFLAGGVLLLARPRLRVDPGGLEVRNVLLTKRLPWDLVLGVSFPDGSPWARLELPDDEYVAVMALQAVDRERAVRAMRRLRELHGRHTVAAELDGRHPVADPEST